MLGLTALAVEDDDLLGVVRVLAANLREEGVEAVIVIHRPAVERMVMTLGTLEPHAHKDLGDVLRQLETIQLALIVVHRGDGHRTAVGGQEIDHDLIDRAILADLVGHPVVVEQRVLIEGGRVVAGIDAGTDLEQLGPFHDPEFSELLTLQKRLDE